MSTPAESGSCRGEEHRRTACLVGRNGQVRTYGNALLRTGLVTTKDTRRRE